MEKILLKTRIAMLWVFICLVLVARQMLFGFQRIAAGVVSPQLGLVSTVWGVGATLVLFAIPFLCLTLKDSVNRWLNILLGLFFTVAGIAGTGSELLLQMASSDVGLYMMDAAATVAPALILYYAYRWPKE